MSEKHIELEPALDDKYDKYPPGGEPLDEEREYIRIAFIICIFAITITISSAITGIVVGSIKNSPTFIAFGLDASFDIIAGIFIIWRFSGRVSTKEEVENIQAKEKRAAVGIAIALIFIAIATLIQALIPLIEERPPTNDTLLYTVSSVLGLLLLLVSIIKFFIAYKLKSLALKQSGICNISGFFFISRCDYCQCSLWCRTQCVVFRWSFCHFDRFHYGRDRDTYNHYE